LIHASQDVSFSSRNEWVNKTVFILLRKFQPQENNIILMGIYWQE
jgi:hypothetical protein